MHPQYLIDPDDALAVRLASGWRDGVLPEGGGLLAQAAATVASIRIVLTAWDKLEAAKRRRKD